MSVHEGEGQQKVLHNGGGSGEFEQSLPAFAPPVPAVNNDLTLSLV